MYRLDSGGTEFPMMIMDGRRRRGSSPRGRPHFHVRNPRQQRVAVGWMDEGLTSYQTDWAQKLTPQERAATARNRRCCRRLSRERIDDRQDGQPVLRAVRPRSPRPGTAIGTTAAGFSEFQIYNDMIYDRAKMMYGHLRDVMGDSAFRAFLHEYYQLWALKHVDERAMRTAAEAVYARASSGSSISGCAERDCWTTPTAARAATQNGRFRRQCRAPRG